MKNLLDQYAQKLVGLQFETKYDTLGSFKFSSVPDPALTFLASSIYKSLKNRSVLVLTASNTEAEFLYRESLSMLDPSDTYYFPGPEVIPYDYSGMSSNNKIDRIKTLSGILHNKNGLVFTSASGFLRSVPSPETLREKSLKLSQGKDYNTDSLIKQLVNMGYKRLDVCEQRGEFTVKGGIIDVFSSYSDEPYRLDFFGDTLDEIKSFDPNTQRSLEKLKKAVILPANEFVLSVDEKKEYFRKLSEFHSLFHKHTIEFDEEKIIEELIPLVHKPVSILKYFSKEPVLIFSDKPSVLDRALHTEREYRVLYEKRKDEMICLPPEQLLSLDYDYLQFLKDKGVTNQLLLPSHLKENEANLSIKPVESFRGKIRDARAKIEEFLIEESNTVLITSSFTAQTERLNNLFTEQGIELLNKSSEEPMPFEMPSTKKHGLYLVLSELRNGFVLEEEKIHVWSDNDIFGRAYKRKSRFKKTNSTAIDSFVDLKEGDYVVHVNHGIGRFLKIEKVTSSNRTRDFLKLEYQGHDTLFVPLEQISLISRYIGGSDRPMLDSLGKSTWKKRKERVQQAVDKLAQELVVMYSNRMKLQGFAYPKDTVWQEEFEAEFEYEETPDQLTSIEAVKADLESVKPMDRLVCGDVGYGKTEVAIRAAFKVVMAGRQVLFIVPTTILALQHYNTLVERFKNFPIKVEMVSRFRTPKEVKASIAKFSEGQLDILVGTHAIITAHLNTKKLGLLIIDEEQRFGVSHKEAIKKMKNLVDVLTMTATPIPRTLHMSLTGIRDLSIIETPPKNRQSVETYVMEDNEEVIRMAIEKEIERGGQVFYLHNRVETIEEEAKALGMIVPDISIGVLHGKLSEDEVEETLIDFNSRKYDLLVTTTIIESGIDMPNVNTMIVRKADMFGLSQLYQIRGRVGRSGRKAFAYLFYSPDKVLTEQAEKRLNTIQEYQELGSGFKVAMRDLEIRGAGNLLGKEQSGDIMEVGFDLYVQMLNETVSKLKGEKVEVETRTALNLLTDFYIPETYIQDTKQKIEFYKKLEASSNIEEIDELTLEIEDRFGPLPTEVDTFILLEKIRTLASSLGFESIIETEKEIKFKAGPHFKGDPQKIIKLISSRIGVYIQPGEPNILRFKNKSEKQKEKLNQVLQIVKKLE